MLSKSFWKNAVVFNLVLLLALVVSAGWNHAATPTPEEQTAFMNAMNDTKGAATLTRSVPGSWQYCRPLNIGGRGRRLDKQSEIERRRHKLGGSARKIAHPRGCLHGPMGLR